MISIHSLLAEGDWPSPVRPHTITHFNPLPPRGGRPASFTSRRAISHFNPLPPRGGRRRAVVLYSRRDIFQSTPSSRRETRRPHGPGVSAIISIHSLLAEGDPPPPPCPPDADISIHSLLAEGDASSTASPRWKRNFNPLPPRGGRPCPARRARSNFSFQSTPSSRRETQSRDERKRGRRFQSTPSSRRETLPYSKLVGKNKISIHSLLAEGDARYDADDNPTTISIHSLLAEGDQADDVPPFGDHISIHSLLAEGDLDAVRPGEKNHYFNPLPPRGGRQNRGRNGIMPCTFQSTPSSRRETRTLCSLVRGSKFQSTPSSRRETRVHNRDFSTCDISIHSLLAEGDPRDVLEQLHALAISIHSLLAEGDGQRGGPARRA